MSAPDRLIAQLLAARTSRCEVAPGKVLLVRRPAEATELGKFRFITAELAIGQVVGWEGITEADLLGAGVGGDSKVEWTRERCDVVLADRSDWLTVAIAKIVEVINEHIEKKGAAEGN